MYPDQSLYPANSVPMVVRKINQAFRRADNVATPARPAVGWIRPENLPTGINPNGGDSAWEFFAYDDPSAENEAHAEIRVRRIARRASEENDTNGIKKRSPLAKSALRRALADEFRVL
jgi:hypothetical protein